MKQYKIFKHPSGVIEAIKQGWSWPAFFFDVLWVFVKQMWWLGAALLLLFVPYVFIRALALLSPELELLLSSIDFIPLLIIKGVLGRFGNSWRARKLISRGFAHVDTNTASNPEGAVALYEAGSKNKRSHGVGAHEELIDAGEADADRSQLRRGHTQDKGRAIGAIILLAITIIGALVYLWQKNPQLSDYEGFLVDRDNPLYVINNECSRKNYLLFSIYGKDQKFDDALVGVAGNIYDIKKRAAIECISESGFKVEEEMAAVNYESAYELFEYVHNHRANICGAGVGVKLRENTRISDQYGVLRGLSVMTKNDQTGESIDVFCYDNNPIIIGDDLSANLLKHFTLGKEEVYLFEAVVNEGGSAQFNACYVVSVKNKHQQMGSSPIPCPDQWDSVISNGTATRFTKKNAQLWADDDDIAIIEITDGKANWIKNYKPDEHYHKKFSDMTAEQIVLEAIHAGRYDADRDELQSCNACWDELKLSCFKFASITNPPHDRYYRVLERSCKPFARE